MIFIGLEYENYNESIVVHNPRRWVHAHLCPI